MEILFHNLKSHYLFLSTCKLLEQKALKISSKIIITDDYLIYLDGRGLFFHHSFYLHSFVCGFRSTRMRAIASSAVLAVPGTCYSVLSLYDVLCICYCCYYYVYCCCSTFLEACRSQRRSPSFSGIWYCMAAVSHPILRTTDGVTIMKRELWHIRLCSSS